MPEKRKFLDFVYLTEDEYKKLLSKLGKSLTEEKLEDLNNYIGTIGEKKASKKYNSHYFAILSWARRDNPPKPKYPSKTRKLYLCTVCKTKTKGQWLCIDCQRAYNKISGTVEYNGQKWTRGNLPISHIEKLILEIKAKTQRT